MDVFLKIPKKRFQTTLSFEERGLLDCLYYRLDYETYKKNTNDGWFKISKRYLMKEGGNCRYAKVQRILNLLSEKGIIEYRSTDRSSTEVRIIQTAGETSTAVKTDYETSTDETAGETSTVSCYPKELLKTSTDETASETSTVTAGETSTHKENIKENNNIINNNILDKNIKDNILDKKHNSIENALKILNINLDYYKKNRNTFYLSGFQREYPDIVKKIQEMTGCTLDELNKYYDEYG